MGKDLLLTFGGAFSNHIYATAAAGKAFGMGTVGIIRGEEVDNPTLAAARAWGMELLFVGRTEYRQKDSPSFLSSLQKQYPNAYLIPEGGTNCLAVQGCQKLMQDIRQQGDFDFVCTPVGTGGTLSGLVKGAAEGQKILGFSSLKGDFLTREVQALLAACPGEIRSTWEMVQDYHFGGYARFLPELIDFINDFKEQHGIPLEPVYTGKMMYGLLDLIQKGTFPQGSHILAIHTGGLQGILGFNQRFGDLIK